MALNISEYPIAQSMIKPVPTLQNNPIYQSNLNYEGTGEFINTTGLSQSINLFNNSQITSPTANINSNNINIDVNQIHPEIQYNNQPINNSQAGILTDSQVNSTKYAAPIYKPAKYLPPKYLPLKVLPNISNIQQSNVTNYANVIPLNSYNSTGNNLNIISNTNTVEQTNTYYNQTTTPITNISYVNEEYNTNNNYQSLTSTQEYITPVSQTSNINYTAEEYQINNYQTQNETENINYEIITQGENIDNNNYVTNEFVDSNQNAQNVDIIENKEIYQIDNNQNEEYIINSNDNQNIPQENYVNSYSYNHQSPLIQNKLNIFSEIKSPVSNFTTQTYNQKNYVYNLENENATFNENLGQLETTEEKVIEEQVAQSSSLKEEATEMASLKAQLDELDELKKKVKELEDLKAQIEQKKSKKKKKIKSQKKKVEKSNKIAEKEEVIQNTKIESMKEESEEKNLNVENIENIENIENKENVENIENKENVENIENKEKVENIKNKKNIENIENKENDTKIALEEKTEQTFVNGDIIHNNEELEMLVRKINKSSQKMTLNLIYKATIDSDRAEEFHKKCDKAKNTLVLIETDKGKRFGGYTSTNWEGNCEDKLDEEAFVFSLDKMEIYENIKGENAIGCYPKFGPVFLGCQIRIYDNAFQRGGTTFEKGLNFNTKEDFELTGGDREFKVKDIEVYEIIAQ